MGGQSTSLGNEDARVHAVVYFIGTDQWVATGKNGDARTTVARDRVVLYNSFGVVADQHAHTLTEVHLVVKYVPAVRA